MVETQESAVLTHWLLYGWSGLVELPPLCLHHRCCAGYLDLSERALLSRQTRTVIASSQTAEMSTEIQIWLDG